MNGKLTREERVQALYDLKVGQVLSQADIENVKMLARMALAAMESEPVAWTDEEELRDVNVAGIGYLFGIDREANKFADPRLQIMLYRHAQPAPELKPVGYLFVSDQGAVSYSPTNWGMPGFRLIGQIYGDMNVELQPAQKRAHKWSYGLVHPEKCQCIECRSARINGVKP